MKKKIIFARAFHIDPEPRLEKAAKWLYEGFNGQVESLAFGWDREKKANLYDENFYLKIQRFRGYGSYGGGFKRNIIGLILYNFYLFKNIINKKCDVIYASDLDTGIVCYLLSKIKRKIFVYDIYDFYSDNRKLPKYLDFILRNLERYIAWNADLTIIADERRFVQIEKNSKYPNNTIVIYNTPELVEIEKQNNFLLSYVGVLIKDRYVDIVAKIICENNIGNMIVAGFGECVKFFELYNRKNLKFCGKVDYKTALNIEGNSDVILCINNPHLKNNVYAAPNKLCEAMMLGKALLTNEGTFCADVVKKYDIGYIFNYDDLDDLRETLKYISLHRDEVKEKGKRAFEIYTKHYSADIMKLKLVKCLKSFLLN